MVAPAYIKLLRLSYLLSWTFLFLYEHGIFDEYLDGIENLLAVQYAVACIQNLGF